VVQVGPLSKERSALGAAIGIDCPVQLEQGYRAARTVNFVPGWDVIKAVESRLQSGCQGHCEPRLTNNFRRVKIILLTK